MRYFCGTILAFILATAAALQAADMEAYNYPFVDQLESTVMGTPLAYRADVPEEVPVRELKLTVFEEREVPRVFWYSEPLEFSVAAQNQEAPLIFMIAGTGASYKSPKMIAMRNAFHQAGFHVISISSPTHMNFIINASTTSVPGRIREDAEDIYRVMELAYQMVTPRVTATEFYLTGYSLGGTRGVTI